MNYNIYDIRENIKKLDYLDENKQKIVDNEKKNNYYDFTYVKCDEGIMRRLEVTESRWLL